MGRMRAAALGLVLGAAFLGATAALGADAAARAAVQAFVARIGEVEIRDLVVEQRVTRYHPDGLHAAVHGEQKLLMKLPGRQRLEEVIDGRREVKLLVDGRTWIRRADGQTFEAPPSPQDRSASDFMTPSKRSADDLLAGWRALGVRDDVSDTVRVGGRAITVIGARAGDRESPAVWLDPERGVVRFIGRETLPKGPTLVDRAFSEHRPLRGGFQFPYRQEVFIGGRLVLVVNVRSAVANVDLPDALFDPGALKRER